MEENPFKKRKLEKEPRVITVDIDDYKIIKPGMMGETTPLGPCFGIIVYDSKTKNAVMGHFADPTSTKDLFNKMILETKKLFKDKEQVKVYVAGGALGPNSPGGSKKDRDNRNFVEKSLRGSDFQIEKINYHDSIDTTTLRIDTRNGKVDFDTKQHWEADFDLENEE